jgi:DNA-binding NtrC family response regulator
MAGDCTRILRTRLRTANRAGREYATGRDRFDRLGTTLQRPNHAATTRRISVSSVSHARRQASRRTVRVLPGDEPEIRVRLDQPLGDAVEAIEGVARALDRAEGNYEKGARLLGISRKGLVLKRRRWGMRRAS